MRAFWEISRTSRWVWASRGGSYCKWDGNKNWMVEWDWAGARIKGMSGSYVRNENLMFLEGYTYTEAANGSLAVRVLGDGEVFSKSGPGIIPSRKNPLPLALILNARLSSYFLRTTARSFLFSLGSLKNVPLPRNMTVLAKTIENACILLKRSYLSVNPTERSCFSNLVAASYRNQLAAVLNTLEGVNEAAIFDAYGVASDDMQAVLEDTGTPAGFHPLIVGYDALPELSADLDLSSLPQEVTDYLAVHERISPAPAELARIKARLRGLYEAGPGVKEHEEAAESDAGSEDDEGAVSGAHIPIPTETFLEELSVKMQIHPISVYWLLEELRAAGARCKPEEQRLLEDRLSVLVLRLLGHRWPRQIEAGEPVPAWADPDGIIPITPGAGETTLAERLRARLRAEDGDLGVQQIEALLAELTGLTLEEWTRREFFKRHVRQFKYRPVAWHLASMPSASGKGRKSSRRPPAFECMLYYHACGGDVLARIRTQYVEPLLRAERQRAEDARRVDDETAAALATERIHELEAFAAKLRQVADDGFACPELDTLLESEPLDRWSGDGYLGPAERSDLERQERVWRVDLNDGVRVNSAPVQLAGLLASDVLKAADAKKAIADRARWRSDERRWVRAGKLPRCGWMDEQVPESRTWTALVPQREAERVKLEEKRRAMVK